jgi:hypothetical protein
VKKACTWNSDLVIKKRCLYHVLIIHVHLSRSLFLRSRKLIPSACGSPCRICWMSSWTSRRVSLAPWLTSISNFLHKEGQKCYEAACAFFMCVRGVGSSNLSPAGIEQCFGSRFIASGSGSSHLGWIPIRIRIQSLDDKNWKKITAEIKNLSFL